MCEERERLIGFVYDECEAGERRAIETHLESCPTCRREISGLRKVRQDLLAWEVPEQAPIWRPVAPVPVMSPWASIPAWALTAAAGLLLMVGAAGGAVTYALLPHGAAPVSRVASATAVPVSTTNSPSSEVVALERRIAELEKARANAASQQSATDLSRVAATTNDLALELRAMRQRQDDFAMAMAQTTWETQRLSKKQNGLEQRQVILTSLADGQVSATGFGSSR